MIRLKQLCRPPILSVVFLLIRPAFTLGGLGGGTAHNMGELVEIASQGILHSAIGQVLIEESILGWQEHEYEVMRDGADNAIIVCTMENIDPMGVHTGESGGRCAATDTI